MEDSGKHVELGDYSKYAVKGKGTIMFHLKSSGFLEARDVLYIPKMKKNFLLVSVLEDMCFVIMFPEMESTHTSKGSYPLHNIQHWGQRGKAIQVVSQSFSWVQGDLGSCPFICEWINVSGRG
jgi:hypothetical protein